MDIPEEDDSNILIAPDVGMNKTQKYIFIDVVHKITKLNDNLHWVLGAACVGKSFLLTKFSQYSEQLRYKVVRLAPTGVSAYNVSGETIGRFFGMNFDRKEVNKLKLNDHVKLYDKSVFLIDEF